MSKNYYKTKWDNLSAEQKYDLAKEFENELANFLIKKCGFNQVIPTRDSIITIAKERGLVLPDLMGVHKNSTEYFIELKEKNRRMFIEDNGIDRNKAVAYLEVQKQFNKRVLLVFRDDELEWKEKFPLVVSRFKDSFGNCVYYGGWVDDLYSKTPDNPYTNTVGVGDKAVKCFPLRDMKKIEELFKEKQTSLNFSVIQ